MTELQQTVKAQKRGSWKAVSAGGRRGGGCTASLKDHSTFFSKTGKTKGGEEMCSRATE